MSDEKAKSYTNNPTLPEKKKKNEIPQSEENEGTGTNKIVALNRSDNMSKTTEIGGNFKKIQKRIIQVEIMPEIEEECNDNKLTIDIKKRLSVKTHTNTTSQNPGYVLNKSVQENTRQNLILKNIKQEMIDEIVGPSVTKIPTASCSAIKSLDTCTQSSIILSEKEEAIKKETRVQAGAKCNINKDIIQTEETTGSTIKYFLNPKRHKKGHRRTKYKTKVLDRIKLKKETNIPEETKSGAIREDHGTDNCEFNSTISVAKTDAGSKRKVNRSTEETIVKKIKLEKGIEQDKGETTMKGMY